MTIQQEENQPSSEGVASASGEASVPTPPAEQASEANPHPATGTDALPKGEEGVGVERLEKAESGTFELDQVAADQLLTQIILQSS